MLQRKKEISERMQACPSDDEFGDDEEGLRQRQARKDALSRYQALLRPLSFDQVVSLMGEKEEDGRHSVVAELAFEEAGDLKLDRDLQLLAAGLFPRQLQGIEGCGSDREIVMKALEIDSWATLQWIDAQLRTDRQVQRAAVRQNGEALLLLKDSCPEVVSDKELVLAAVGQKWDVLVDVSDSLRSDIDVALAALRQSAWAIAYVSESLYNDPQVAPFHEEYLRLKDEREDKE